MCVTGCVFVCMEMMMTDRWWMNNERERKEGIKGERQKEGEAKEEIKEGKRKGTKVFILK